MDEQKQIIQLCRVCGYEREYDNNHRLYVACKKCASIRRAKHYQKIEERIWRKPNLIEKTTKINLNKIENRLFHMRKIYRIFKMKLTPQQR